MLNDILDISIPAYMLFSLPNGLYIVDSPPPFYRIVLGILFWKLFFHQNQKLMNPENRCGASFHVSPCVIICCVAGIRSAQSCIIPSFVCSPAPRSQTFKIHEGKLITSKSECYLQTKGHDPDAVGAHRMDTQSRAEKSQETARRKSGGGDWGQRGQRA